MAVTKTLSSTSLSIEVENGTNSKGEIIYTKKTFSDVNPSSNSDDIFEVVEAIKNILGKNTRYYYLTETSTIQES